MLCENAYYVGEKVHCRDERKSNEDPVFKTKCPFVYYCAVDEKYENTTDMFDCIYRETNDDR